MQEHANEFVKNVVSQACELAKHRGGNVLELRDMRLVLERRWNIVLPGYENVRRADWKLVDKAVPPREPGS